MISCVVLSDLQVPLQDRPLVESVFEFTREYAPDYILCVGDEADSTELGRWTKGLAEEYAPTLQSALNETRDLMAAFASIAPLHIQRSNHTDRLENYIARYAPALASLSGLKYETLLGYDTNPRITFHPRPWEFSPGWWMLHGDENGTSQVSGQSVRKATDAFGASVVQGHSHRMGQYFHTASAGGQVLRTRIGVEVGHMMDMRLASYLKGGSGNWQQGFATLHIEDDIVTPALVPVLGGGFTVEGSRYTVATRG